MIAEWHTTDLASPCMQRVKLRHEGKILPDVACAMYRGLIFHEAVRLWHEQGGSVDMDYAVDKVQKALQDESRVLTEAALKKTDAIIREVGDLLVRYSERFSALFSACRVIGCEVPIRATFAGVEFATHIDLLFRDSDDLLNVWDWKTGEEPSFESLIRNRQLAGLAAAVEVGECLIDGEWIAFAEQPRVAWVQVDALKPYARATKAVDYDTGEQREYAKGECRPLDKIVRYVPPVDVSKVTELLIERQAMAEAGFWPASPTATGCRVCESRRWCPTLIQEQAHE